MHSVIMDGKICDCKFSVKKEVPFIHDFYVGDILIGQLFKMGKSKWSAVSWHTSSILCPVHGFRSRIAAAEFLLVVCRFTKRDQPKKGSTYMIN